MSDLSREIDADALGVVGESAAWKSVLRFVRRAAPYPTTVLLLGESGTGKERVARAIHRLGPRREGPFVAVNCGALSEGLLESELFGHRAGAFTGALKDRVGLFESAAAGTLFLDEVGDAPLSLQVRLLRALEEREVRRVGETGSRPVDVRVVAATNKDLRRAVGAGEFREDLYYRLHVLSARLPSLRERPEDVPLLASHLLARIAERHGRRAPALADESLALLSAYPWPGNVRELENELERAVAFSPAADVLGPAAFSAHLGYRDPGASAGAAGTLKERLEGLEREILLQALRSWNGNQTQAARTLGLSRQGLIKKIRRFDLRVDRRPYEDAGERAAARAG